MDKENIDPQIEEVFEKMAKGERVDPKPRCQGCEYEEVVTAHDGYKFVGCKYYSKAVWEILECSAKTKGVKQ